MTAHTITSSSVRWIAPEEITILWPRVAPLIDRAMLTQGRRAGVLKDDLETGRKLLLIGERGGGIKIVCVVDYWEEQNVLCIYAVAGEGLAEFFEEAQDMLLEYARELGATHIRGYAREGFVRALARHGWRRAATVIEREVTYHG